MWKATAGYSAPKVTQTAEDDDWDTDPDFVNDVSEKEQRKGAKTIEASTAPKDAIDIASLRQTVVKTNEEIVRKNYESKGTFAYGYGGKFGVQAQTDKAAVGFDAPPETAPKHSSVPQYQKPAVAAGKSTAIRSQFEQLNAGAEAQDKVAELRAQRAAKEAADRERIAREQAEREAAEREAAAKERAERQAREKEERERREKEEAARREFHERDAREREQAARLEQEKATKAKAEQERLVRERVERENREREERERAEREQEAAYARQQAERLAQQQAADAAAQPEPQAEEPQYYEEAQPEPAAEPAYEEQPAEAAATGASARALYDYDAGGDDEISFKEGDIITNVEAIDEGWSRGECNGAYGLFPANYVEMLS